MANLTQLELPNGETYNLQDTISGYVATDATTSAHGLMSASDKTKLNGIATGAEVNQNAFSNVKVGTTTVAADAKTDTLELVGGANITLTPDATNDKITILLDDTVTTGEVIATEVQAGDLVVSGTSRFINTINGTASNSEKLNGQSLTSTYSSTGTAPITGTAVASAIGALDGVVTGSPSASKTLTAFSQTDGKVSATFGNILITKSQVSDFPTLGTAAAKNYTTSVTSGSSDLVTSGAVWTAIDNLPEPMIFKGSLGTGGTITTLPTASTANTGYTYKVITAGTYASQAAKVGDTFISDGSAWVLIPSGDEPSGTVTSVGVSNGGGLSVSGSPITSSGTITISHLDTSSQASVSNSGRTYIQSITLDTYGHVTALSSATETVTNTDRYVNSAAFAHDSTNDNVKMTLTRAGSDTATVTANIPKVSSSSAGVAPKGATVSSQSQTTKFLREDGTWAAPSYTTNTNTTYSMTRDGESIKLTPSSGTAQSITLSSLINGLSTGSSTPVDADYYVSQYVNGGTSTTTYHRRPMSALWTYIKGKADLVYSTTDTKNTAGSTDTQSKIYLIGATSQDTAYVGTDGCVYSGGNKVEVISNNAGYHNSVYRGKSLGTSITEAQWAAISAGTFDDLYIGDYWTLSTTLGSTTSNVQYVIAGFDYWWNCGDSYPQSSNKHHVVLVPASYLYSAQMNTSNVTTGGYIGSAMYTTNLANARTGISTLFGDHLYSVRRLFTNSVNASGQAVGWAWATSSVDLMNENMVYGSSVWTTSGFEVGVDRTILPLFALNPASASIRADWWLRSVATPSDFADVAGSGVAYYYSASASGGVRPAFAIY